MTRPARIASLIVSLSLMLVCVPACGKIHLPRLPDGSLDVVTLVNWASDGIEADCSLGFSQDVCTFGRDTIDDVRAAMDKDPLHRQQAAWKSFSDSAARWPVIQPYVQWVIDALHATIVAAPPSTP